MFTPELNTAFSSGVNTLLSADIYDAFMTSEIQTPLDRLLAEAQRRHWRDVDLCNRLGISQQRLNNWKDRGLPLQGAVEAASKLRLSLDYLVFGKEPAASGNLTAAEPAAPYGVISERQRRLLELFDELTEQQQNQILGELVSHVDANRAVVKHFSGRPLRHVDNARIEATFGIPDSISTKAGS